MDRNPLPLSPDAAAVLDRAPLSSCALPADPDHCHWGYIDPDERAVLHVESGSQLAVETVTHHAGDAPELMMDAGIEALWAAIPEVERGPGVHILTGPVDVAGAEEGDVLVVDIVDLRPRLPYGSNCAAHWGLLHSTFQKERITIYELAELPADRSFPRHARPVFAYDFKGRDLYDVPGYVSFAENTVREPFTRDVLVPVRPHFGVVGVAPAESGRRSSIPPGVFGGNVDNWRFGPGARIHFPVFREGAGLYFGDPHFAQGDGEVCGTAIEASSNGVVRVALAKDVRLEVPVLETSTHWYTHGFGDDLDAAMVMAVEQLLKLLQDRIGLSADDAYSLLSVAADLGITQVVDGTVGCHAGIATSIVA
jgi:acetamidase/formamidase